MTKYVSDTKAGKSVSGYVILDRKGQHVATVKAHFSDAGTCLVNVHDNKAGFQSARASGYGYDKFAAALSGLSIDGHTMTGHCGERLNRPKAGFFPANFKAPKGYSLANFGARNAATGERIDSYSWRDKAIEAWRESTGSLNGLQYPSEQSDWEQVKRDARRLATEASERGETVDGYSDCYREPGLKYLEAIGYRVIQAI